MRVGIGGEGSSHEVSLAVVGKSGVHTNVSATMTTDQPLASKKG